MQINAGKKYKISGDTDSLHPIWIVAPVLEVPPTPGQVANIRNAVFDQRSP